MKFTCILKSAEIDSLKKGLIEYARKFDYACILDSHYDIFGSQIPFTQYDLVAGFGTKNNAIIINTFEELSFVRTDLKEWLLGYLTYDVKNQIEKLQSQNPDYLQWPEIFFFQPEILFLLKGRKLNILSVRPINSIQNEILDYKQSINKEFSLLLKSRISREEYISTVSKIKENIQLGNLYEINYCQEFYNTCKIDPYTYFNKLKSFSPSPFSAFYKYQNKYLLSASPERFLLKTGNRLISQPIKGTAPRGENAVEDFQHIRELKTSIKERSENIMIVDIVRNDLSRIAKRNTVKVEELCGIHSFPQVHQMISTISAEVIDCSFTDILKAAFPMGSMTGAPKISAMKLAEKYECSKRGLYSGTVGYIAPGMDFDFNVVIRSLQYNAENSYLSYMAGSAITALSYAEKEYEECLLKVYGLQNSCKIDYYA